jgi:hypothetical protein
VGRSVVVGSRRPSPPIIKDQPFGLDRGLWLVAPSSSAWVAWFDRGGPRWQRLGGVRGHLLVPWRPAQAPAGLLTLDLPAVRRQRAVRPVAPGVRHRLAWRCVGGDLYAGESGRLDGLLHVDGRVEPEPLFVDPPRPETGGGGPGRAARILGHMAFAGRDVGLEPAMGLAISLCVVRAVRAVSKR